MVSWLTLLYVLRSPHKMFFNILGNCYKMFLHFMSGLQCRNGLIADIVVCSSMSQLSHCLHCCMCFNVAMVSLLTLLYVLQCRNGLIADIVVCASMSPWSHGWHYKLKKLYIGPIKCFYILWNCYKMCSRVHSSVHTNNNHPHKMVFTFYWIQWFTPAFTPIKCFYILGNCYPMCPMVHSHVHPIKCFYILWKWF